MPFLLANWRVLALLAVLAVAGAAVGVSRLQVANCRADLATVKAAHDLLLERVRQQNAAVDSMAKAAKEAAARAAQERARAAGTVKIAKDKAANLEHALSAPRQPSECPAGDAVRLIRADLAGG